jgi:hypothetical protein
MLTMVERNFEYMADKRFAPHHRHHVPGNRIDGWMLMAPGAAERGARFDVDDRTLMFAMATEAFEAARSA